MEYKRGQYQDKFQLLNKTEQLLFNRLQEAAPNLHVFPQVSMSQLFHIANYRKSGFLQIAEIGRKSVDFVLCRKDDTSIVLAIELNGPTHEKENQKISDAKKQAALEEAGIPLAIFKPGEIPETLKELREFIAPYIVDRRKYEAEKREAIDQANSRKKQQIDK